MILKRISLLFAFISLLILPLFSQSNPYGLPWIQNYHFSETGGSEQNWCITQDSRGLIYVGNHDKGILEYDGSSWRTIPVPGDVTVRSLVSGEDGYIYAGLEGNFGRLEPDLRGHLHFRTLLDSTTKNRYPDIDIWNSYFQEGKVYFCAREAIFVFDPATREVSIIETTENPFLAFFANDTLYMGDYILGLIKHDGDSFIKVPGGEFFNKKDISGLVAFDSTHLLISTFSSGIFLMDLEEGSVDSTFLSPELQEELNAAVVVHIQIRENDLFVGTFLGGLYILDKQGNITDQISGNNGLLDNAISRVHLSSADNGNYSVWIAHWKGVSRVDINSPFRSVSIGQGRTGMGGMNSGELITDICEFQGRQYVSTLGGVLLRSENPDRPGFRPLRGIRAAILDLQVINPSSELEFLMAISEDRTYVIDPEMRISTLELGGQKLLSDPENPSIIYGGNYHFMGFQYRNGNWLAKLDVNLNNIVNDMCFDQGGNAWISTRSALLRLELSETSDYQIHSYGVEKGLPKEEGMLLFIDPESGELLVGTSEGFYRYDSYQDTLFFDSLFNSPLPQGANGIMTFHKGADNLYWFSFENEYRGWSILGARRSSSGFELIYDRPFRSLRPAASTDVFYTDEDKQLWFSKSNQLFHFDQSKSTEDAESFQVLIRNVRISGDSILFYGTNFLADTSGQRRVRTEQEEASQPRLKYLYRDIEFQWSAPYFMHERQTRYSYFLEGFSSQWSDWGRSRSIKLTNLPHGKYVMQVKAWNIFGDESPPASFAFTISRPWYATFVAIALYIVLSISLAIFVLLYTRSLKHRAELLERQNREIELQKQELENLNEETTAQRDEIEAQRDSITAQKELIGRQKNAMTDSIRYARRIQDAVLPAKEVMRYLLPKHFVFYRPRDIVSGDFFWVDKKDETIWLSVADCTGHGVPGAFMSMLGISLLNEISGQYSGQPTHEIMDELRDQVIASLGQTGDRYEAKDGMEMALVAINTKTREVQFTGAMQNLYTFQKGELLVIKGDRMPVGIHSEGSTLFTSHKLTLERGDTLYLFTDGYPDQFGGKDRKKFGSARLKALLTKLQNNIMHDQKEAIKKEFDQWKGDQEQIDDVLMIGIKL